MTVGFLHYLRENLSAYPTISRAGFDDINWNRLIDPTITAIEQPEFEVGQVAGQQLLRAIGGTGSPGPPSMMPVGLEPTLRGFKVADSGLIWHLPATLRVHGVKAGTLMPSGQPSGGRRPVFQRRSVP